MCAMATDPQTPAVVPRGRHAPPLEVRLNTQRRRLFEAAAAVFHRLGYADASAEAIAKQAGMSKATFYEHFANKEECLSALFDEAATTVITAIRTAGDQAVADNVPTYEAWVGRRIRAFLSVVQSEPELAHTLLVEVIGAGPRARERRDEVLDGFTEVLLQDNAANAPRYDAGRFTSREDVFAAVGALTEVAGRLSRTGGDVEQYADSLTRLVTGLLR